MHQSRKITDDVYYVGGSDRRISRFENVFPVPDGIAYNSYLVLDEKTVLLDTVDLSVSRVFLENIEHLLNGRKLNYVIINHMECDHSCTLEELVLRYPDIQFIGNAKTFTFMKQFFKFPVDGHTIEVKEGSTLTTGKHTFSFHMAPMVHWPEVMMTYDTTEKIMFTSDAFGTFGALNGNIFVDELEDRILLLPEARRYYTNIVGKYGAQVQAVLKKIAPLDIRYICALHGPVWNNPKDIAWILDKYNKWSSYTPENEDIVIFYGSIYGNTENAVNVLSVKLAQLGVKNIKMYDVAEIDISYLIAEAFRAKVLVFASSSYNAGVFDKMEYLLLDLKAHNIQNRSVMLIENGSWAPSAAKAMNEIISGMKNINLLSHNLSIKSQLNPEQEEQINATAQVLKQALQTS